MVSFQCEGCGDVLTKKKLDAHSNRCRGAPFSCIDCMTQFWGKDYKSHTSCISEAQKYQGALYKEPTKQRRQQTRQEQQPVKTPSEKVAYVEDDVDTPERRSASRKTATVLNVPPPAPTPPSAVPSKFTADPVNVFDYMVKDATSPLPPPAVSPSSSTSSSYKSFSNASQTPRSVSPEVSISRMSADPGYSYGTEPLVGIGSKRRHDSKHDEPDDALLQRTPSTTLAKTPARERKARVGFEEGLSTTSERKRKRAMVEESIGSSHDSATERNRVLHSGLTGGLDKLLSRPTDQDMEASPLSPKKRAKRSKEKEHSRESRITSTALAVTKDGAVTRKVQEKHASDLALVRQGENGKESAHGNSSRRSQGKASKPLQAKMRSVGQARSEYFVSLIQKGQASVKGQSLLSTLKAFHDGCGVVEVSSSTQLIKYASPAEEVHHNEQALFKGLRLKMNKHGEIVLFSRPESERHVV